VNTNKTLSRPNAGGLQPASDDAATGLRVPCVAGPTTSFLTRASRRLAKRDQKIRRITNRVRSLCSLIEPADALTLRAYAELEVLAEEVYSKLREQGILRPDGSQEGKALLDVYQRIRKTQLAHASALGLTVAARGALRAGGSLKDATLDADRVRRVEEIHATRSAGTDEEAD
jgi:hypothetical protein